MIKSLNLKPYVEKCDLPGYAYNNGVEEHILVANIPNDYCIVLGKLYIGDTTSSNGVILTHVRFKSFDEHGHKMIETKMRVAGLRELEGKFIAVENAMINAGVEFNSMPPCHFLDLLKGLGAFYQAANPDILICCRVTNVPLTNQ